MNSSPSISSEEMECDFKNTISCEKENLYNFNKQLESSFDIDTTDGDELEIGQEMLSCTKQIDNFNWQVLNDQLQDQMGKINKYTIMEYEWELKNNELQNSINHISAELKSQKCNEKALLSKIESYEKKIKCIQKELCSTQSKLEEQNCEIKKLCTIKKTNEEDICKLRGQLCECRKESDRLIENNKLLAENLKCAKTDMNAQKLCIATMEENIKNDRETFSCELKNKCKKLKEMKVQYEEMKCQLDEETCKVKNLVLALNEKNCSDSNKCLLALKPEQCTKENSIICQLENKSKELQQQNELRNIELRYNQNNCQSEQMRVFSEKLCKVKQKCSTNQCPEKKIQKPVCCTMKTSCCTMKTNCCTMKTSCCTMKTNCCTMKTNCCSTPTNCCKSPKNYCNTPTNCCSTQKVCCKVEKSCENFKTISQKCCKTTNTSQKCDQKCDKPNKTNPNDLVCKLNNLKKDIETLQIK